MFGEDCFYLTVHLRSIDELSDMLDRFLVHGETIDIHRQRFARPTSRSADSNPLFS